MPGGLRVTDATAQVTGCGPIPLFHIGTSYTETRRHTLLNTYHGDAYSMRQQFILRNANEYLSMYVILPPSPQRHPACTAVPHTHTHTHTNTHTLTHTKHSNTLSTQ